LIIAQIALFIVYHVVDLTYDRAAQTCARWLKIEIEQYPDQQVQQIQYTTNFELEEIKRVSMSVKNWPWGREKERPSMAAVGMGATFASALNNSYMRSKHSIPDSPERSSRESPMKKSARGIYSFDRLTDGNKSAKKGQGSDNHSKSASVHGRIKEPKYFYNIVRKLVHILRMLKGERKSKRDEEVARHYALSTGLVLEELQSNRDFSVKDMSNSNKGPEFEEEGHIDSDEIENGSGSKSNSFREHEIPHRNLHRDDENPIQEHSFNRSNSQDFMPQPKTKNFDLKKRSSLSVPEENLESEQAAIVTARPGGLAQNSNFSNHTIALMKKSTVDNDAKFPEDEPASYGPYNPLDWPKGWTRQLIYIFLFPANLAFFFLFPNIAETVSKTKATIMFFMVAGSTIGLVILLLTLEYSLCKYTNLKLQVASFFNALILVYPKLHEVVVDKSPSTHAVTKKQQYFSNMMTVTFSRLTLLTSTLVISSHIFKSSYSRPVLYKPISANLGIASLPIFLLIVSVTLCQARNRGRGYPYYYFTGIVMVIGSIVLL